MTSTHSDNGFYPDNPENSASQRLHNNYCFPKQSSAFANGLREISFSDSHAVKWRFGKAPVVTLEMDVLHVGNRFDGYKRAIEEAYNQLPDLLYPSKKCWVETIQHPSGMRDRIHVVCNKPLRFLGLLAGIPLGLNQKPLVTIPEIERAVPSFNDSWVQRTSQHSNGRLLPGR